MKKVISEKTKEIQERNRMLESLLEDLENQNKVLKDVAWVQSHELRGPLSRLLGLVDVVVHYDQFKTIKKEKTELLDEISQAADELDAIIRKINADIENYEQVRGERREI